jgi:subtilisin-like proprotein convertase family protein
MKRVSWLLFGAVISAAVGCGSDDPSPPVTDEADLPQEAAQQIEALLAEKASRTPAQKKIASTLLYEKSKRFEAVQNVVVKDPALKPTSLTKHDAQGRVLVDIQGEPTTVSTALVAKGGAVVGTSTVHQSVRAWIALDRVEEIAAMTQVRAIRPAFGAATDRADAPGGKVRAGTREERVAAMQQAVESWSAPSSLAAAGPQSGPGSRLSQGVKAHGAERAQKFYGARGAGVTVGVISDSDDFLEQSIATGDLPASTVTIPGQDGRPGSGEGTAMMEIVHDVAPDANLVFATAFNGPEQFAENIRALRFTYHADVIVDDVIYYFESPYQDDIVAQAVADVVADGGQYFSSAGNSGNYSDGTSGTWEGDFKPAGTLATLPSGYTVHNFGNKVISDRLEKTGGPIYLHWSDPGTLAVPASFNDYDLFVLDQDLRNVVAASTDLQDGAGLPFEGLDLRLPPGYRIVVAKHPQAEIRAIRAVVYRGELGIATPGSTYGHNSTADAFGVAAVNSAEAAGGEFFAGPTTPVEIFSSDGPRRMFYDRDGNPIKGGVTFASGGGELRNKPDITGADGVSTTLPAGSGLNPFFGTSAAAPHVAAIAALVKSAVPSISAAQLRKVLLDGALDIEAAGNDQDSGRGIASAMNSLKKANAPTSVYLETNTLSLTPNGSDALLPGGSASLRVQLINNGGQKATAVSATLSSSTPGVTITSATSTYPNVASGATATNPTAYAFSVGPMVPCGAQIAFTLTLNYTGTGAHPMVIEFTLPTGRLTPFPQTVSYAGGPVAIPDGDGTSIDIPLALAASTVISKVVFHVDGAWCSIDEGATTVGLDHSWVSDLSLSLTSPNGTTVMLADHAGGEANDANNFCQTYFDDTSTQSIQNVTPLMAPFSGFFAPATPLASFAGENAAGTWTLHATDSISPDGGSVRAFGIDVYGYSCAP